MVMGAGNPYILAIAATASLITLIVANWDKITGFFNNIQGGSSPLGSTGNYGTGSAIDDMYGAPVSPNTGMIAATSSSSVSRSVVDLNIPNPPPGTSAIQRGAAPGFTLNLGRQMGGSR